MSGTRHELTAEIAERFAGLTLGHLGREFPNHPGHVLTSAADLRTPRALHPVFYGSYDWHSCVHGWWQVARLGRLFPGGRFLGRMGAHFDLHLTAEHVAAEVGYFERGASRSFERPYGWGWLLALAAELDRHATAEGRRWRATIAPLAELIAGRLAEFLGQAIYPIRSGTHANTSFAASLAHDYAVRCGDGRLLGAIRAAAEFWYGRDEGCQAWEPSLSDFLSPALVEADCMRRVLGVEAFRDWLGRFLPWLATGEPEALFKPASVPDRTDGHVVHLDGLNLSRAWCWRGIASALEAGDPRRGVVLEAAEAHWAASLPHVSGDYMGEHWLATFAVLGLSGF